VHNDILAHNYQGSFKDPDGYVIVKNATYYRVLTSKYAAQYRQLMDSGLYQQLVDKKMLIPHQEVDLHVADSFKVIQPEQLSFISYAYEWSFNQLKDAALLTLDIQLAALDKGMTLKDASAFNVQYHQGTPVFIDTSSFELLDEKKPWVAYGQFCRHFLAPLALMSYTDLRLNALFNANLDGIPLDLCAKLLPFKSKFNLGIYTHLHLHAKAVKNYEAKNQKVTSNNGRTLNLKALQNIIKHLRLTVDGLKNLGQKTEWDDYYASNNNYTDKAFTNKQSWINAELEKRSSDLKLGWDVGANDGTFSRILAKHAQQVVAMDIDTNAVDANYLRLKKEGETNILPLVIDLANPSAAYGWNTQERESIFERNKPDIIMALALIHHISIGLNVPLANAASFFAQRTNKYLLIEFVAPEDSQVKKLLLNRVGQFDSYHMSTFKQAFLTYFDIEAESSINESYRTLFLLKKK
jgi:hypothetical protein